MNSTRPSRGHDSSESQRQDTSHSGNDRIWLTRSSSPLFNPNRMLKKSASFVLAAFRPSTGTRPPHHSAARTDVVLLIRRSVRPRGYASGLHPLSPCWTNVLPLSHTFELSKVSHANIVFL